MSNVKSLGEGAPSSTKTIPFLPSGRSPPAAPPTRCVFAVVWFSRGLHGGRSAVGQDEREGLGRAAEPGRRRETGRAAPGRPGLPEVTV